MMTYLLIATVVLALCGSLNASTCYQCSYVAGLTEDNDCLDPFEPSNSTLTCEGTYCMKSTAKTGGDLMSVTRSCSDICTEICASILGLEGCGYCCQGDLCNGASSATLNMVAVITTVAAFLFA